LHLLEQDAVGRGDVQQVALLIRNVPVVLEIRRLPAYVNAPDVVGG
jgi:hypothetical protein